MFVMMFCIAVNILFSHVAKFPCPTSLNRISCVIFFRYSYKCMQLCVLDGFLCKGCIVNTILKEITGKIMSHATRSSLRCAI